MTLLGSVQTTTLVVVMIHPNASLLPGPAAGIIDVHPRLTQLPDKLLFVAALQWTVDSGKWTVVVSPSGMELK